MRVLHLTTEFPPVIYGGLGTAIGGLVRASASAGLGVGVLLFGSTGGSTYGQFVPLSKKIRLNQTHRQGSVAIFGVSWFQDIETCVRVAVNFRPDILHLHSFWVWPTAQALRDRLAKPLVYTVHSLDRAEYELGQGPPQCISQAVSQEAVIYRADRIIALTRSERELLKQYCPGVDDRVRIVGNGIEDVGIAPRPTSERGMATVLFTGRFVERKGIRELIDAIGIVLDQAPTTRFILAGGHRNCTGSEMESWLLPPTLHSYRSRIHFTGWLTPTQMAAWYRKTDILVVPSWYEPFGMVVIEGMLHGLAVAASAVGGPGEILEHNRTGLLFHPRNAAALGQAILTLVKEPDRRVRIAVAGAKEVRKKWLWPRIVEKMQNVYSELVPLEA
jgi:glycosyltransferase involved in cell wall biosynthesis